MLAVLTRAEQQKDAAVQLLMALGGMAVLVDAFSDASAAPTEVPVVVALGVILAQVVRVECLRTVTRARGQRVRRAVVQGAAVGPAGRRL